MTVSERFVPTPYERLKEKLQRRDVVVGICGLGYVGLPLARAITEQGLKVIGFDSDGEKIEQLNAGRSYIKHVPSEYLAIAVDNGLLVGTNDYKDIGLADVVLICVPTPLGRYREPDLSYVLSTGNSVADHARPGQLIVLESTTYPGTTRTVLGPLLEMRGFTLGTDMFLAFSPEREDPGNPDFSTRTIPKIVGADSAESIALVRTFYELFIDRVIPVSSAATAEAVKLTENIFRAVNIALVNELKIIYGAMDIDIWEVIEGAKSKPFGYMPFYPGPGLGGHCIPIDPYYLTWKAREHEIVTRFIELAGEINTAMPRLVVDRLAEAIDRHQRRGMNGARILIVGLAYKQNVDDIRESPSLKLIELIEGRGGLTEYHDPFVPVIPRTREHSALADRRSVPIEDTSLGMYNAVLIATDHDDVDYQAIVRHARLVVDTRNACGRRGLIDDHVVKA